MQTAQTVRRLFHRNLGRRVIAFALGTVVVALVNAQPLSALPQGAITPQGGKRVALVIGNERYVHESALKNPVNDADLLERTLKVEMGFDRVIKLPNATHKQMQYALAAFAEEAQGAYAAVVYFSGHGMANSKDQNYLLPVDVPRVTGTDKEQDAHLKVNAVPTSDITQAVAGATVQLVILDACRARTGVGSGGANKDINFNADKGLARNDAGTRSSLLVAYATQPGKVAKDGEGANSPYAKSLAQYLKRSDLTVLEALDAVSDDVETVSKNTQRPDRAGNLRARVYLINPTIIVNNPPPAPRPAFDAEDEAYKAAIAADVVEGYEQYLRDFEKGRNASAVKIRLAAAKRREAQASVPTVRPAEPVIVNNTPPTARPAPVADEARRQEAPAAPAPIRTTGYSKISNSGKLLPDSAALGERPDDWACTKDNATGLIWEVKATAGLRDQEHSYTWFDRTVKDGDSGTKSGGTCHQSGRCDTEKFVVDVNASGLCGASDWRMPSSDELHGIVRKESAKEENASIDLTFFPNTPRSHVWSGSPFPNNSSLAWYVHFRYGNVGSFYRSNAYSVRVVRGGQ